MIRTIDLNADVGEGYGRWQLGDDAAIMASITSANIACGFHAGDPSTIRRTCELAVAHGVAIGAQVAYPDLMGFGRRYLDIDPADLTAGVIYQIGALDALARSVGGRVEYVKPHGALYHAVVHHELQAGAVVDAVTSLGGTLPIVGLANSVIEHRATAQRVRFVPEGFADRAYDADGHLVDRRMPGAVLDDPTTVAAQATALLAWRVESICVHSDTPGAPALAAAVRAALVEAGATVAAFRR